MISLLLTHSSPQERIAYRTGLVVFLDAVRSTYTTTRELYKDTQINDMSLSECQSSITYQFYLCEHCMPPGCLRHPAPDACFSNTGCRTGAEARIEAQGRTREWEVRTSRVVVRV